MNARTLNETQYRQLIASERAQLHRASTASRLVLYLPHRNMWMTANPGRRGTVVVRFYPRCPCEAA